MKRRLHMVSALVLLYACLELFSFTVYYLYTGAMFHFSDMRAAMARQSVVIQQDAPDTDMRNEALRYVPQRWVRDPYLGYGDVPGLAGMGDNFLDRRKDEKTLKVGLVGGSVIHDFYYSQGAEALRRKLREAPLFHGRNIELVLLSQRGYKQPQQLIAVTLYLLFGGDLDILVNLDGHNEVVEAHAAYDMGMFYAYPRIWPLLTNIYQMTASPEHIGKILSLRYARQKLARFMEETPAHYSITADTLWMLADRAMGKAIAGWQYAMTQNIDPRRHDQSLKGPFQPYGDAELEKLLVHLWSQSSMELQALAQRHGIAYFHFLQPIPQWPDSKPFSDSEKPYTAIPAEYPYKLQHYRALLAEGERLRQKGVSFISLLDVFHDTAQTVYADNCCHVVPPGHEIIGNAIGDSIITHLTTKDQ